MAVPRSCVFCLRQPAQPPWEPFCSERCKLQDLARWVDGRYRVPAEPVPQDPEDGNSRGEDETDR